MSSSRSVAAQHQNAHTLPFVAALVAATSKGSGVINDLERSLADYLALSTVVVGTPMAVARRARVSSDGVWRPASTRAMFGR